jgi:biopolymer transport protein ExbD
VVFQLLIFFIITLKVEDILAHLDVSRPAPDSKQTKEQEIELVEILVGHLQTGFSMKGRVMTIKEVDKRLGELAAVDRTVPILIKCTGPSRHGKLVEVLDACSKHKLTNLSVFSM